MSLSEMQPRIRSARLRVLIADDMLETRRSTRLMLTLIPGVEVVAIAQNGREAVELARKTMPDIALMDVNMPEMDGLAAIEAMLRQRPNMACIVISAERDHETLRRAVAAGAHGYLIKPYSTDDLKDAMKRVSHVIKARQQQPVQTGMLQQQRDDRLIHLAAEYVRTRRTDDHAVALFERLASSPDCEQRWLMTLAMVYVVRKQWSDLKRLAERLEQKTR